jgi:hypothetical protein
LLGRGNLAFVGDGSGRSFVVATGRALLARVAARRLELEAGERA